MKLPARIASLLLNMTALSPCALAEDAAPAAPTNQPPAMDPAMQAEIEKQFFVSMVAIKDYCKQSDPARTADYDQSWAKNTADVPAPLKALSETPEFAQKIAARLKELVESAKTPEAAASLKVSCDKIADTK